MALDLTKLSQKGQVVIPNTVRREMGLKEGMRFLVLGIGDTIVLRRLDLADERKRLRKLLREAKGKAGKIGFTEKGIERLVQHMRKGL